MSASLVGICLYYFAWFCTFWVLASGCLILLDCFLLFVFCISSNNAGVMGTPFTLSKDNIELHFATNHLGNSFSQFFTQNIAKQAWNDSIPKLFLGELASTNYILFFFFFYVLVICNDDGLLHSLIFLLLRHTPVLHIIAIVLVIDFCFLCVIQVIFF